MERKKILPLNESKFKHDLDNPHFNSIGTLCELILDNIINKKLNEQLGVNTYVKSDFDYNISNGEVVSISLIFNFKLEDLNEESYVNALTLVLNEIFETNDISLVIIEKTNSNGITYYTTELKFSDKDKMLWLIEALNKLDIKTEKTFEIVV